jgi:hypothetical protein
MSITVSYNNLQSYLHDLSSTDLSLVLRGLNSITKLSHEAAASVPQPSLALIIIAMGELLDVVNPFCHGNKFQNEQIYGNELSVYACVESKQKSQVWNFSFHEINHYHIKLQAQTSYENVVLIMIFNIIRNYSSEVKIVFMFARLFNNNKKNKILLL